MMPPVTRSAALAVAPFDLRPRLFPTPRVAALAVALLALLVLFAAVTLPGTAFAAAPQEDLALQQRLKHLESELRCLVCQNQTLADSNSELANDLRDEVKKLALSGKNDDEIKSYLVARYGDFVLYRPPVKSTTWLLWTGPFVLLIGGAVVWWQVLRRRRAALKGPDLSAEDRALARKLLEGDGGSSSTR